MQLIRLRKIMYDLTDNRNPDVVEPDLLPCVECGGIYDEVYEDGRCQVCDHEYEAKLDAFTDGVA